MMWHILFPVLLVFFAFSVRAMYRRARPAIAARKEREQALADYQEKIRAIIPAAPPEPTHEPSAAIQAAVDLARRHFPDFVIAFERRNVQQHFSAKGRFRAASRFELLWVTVTAIENNVIFGVLDNNPAKLKSLHAGSKVKIERDDLYDWLIAVDHKIIAGGFTIQALHDAAKSGDA